ncbi:hypothetical protein TNCV_4507271 [Trichonephila clavipes]|nr:hypothetical protein TNCV_4507271 [Trichonephila clavipes]
MDTCQVDIISNEQADNLVKEARNSPRLYNSRTLSAGAIARSKLASHSVKEHFIPDLNCYCVISTTIAKLSTRHFKVSDYVRNRDLKKGING